MDIEHQELIGDWAELIDISGEYFYMVKEIEENGVIYSCPQDNIKALFNQMRREYKPNTTP